MASFDANMIIVITSIFLFVNGIRDLLDKTRGTANQSTWFMSALQMILAFFLFMFARK